MSSVLVDPSTVLVTSMPSTLSWPWISVTVWFQRNSILGLANAPVLHDLAGAQLVAAVDDRDLGGELGEEAGLLDRRVATADDRDVLIAEEEAVAGRAGGHAVADQTRLVVDAEHQRPGAGGHDDRIGGVFVVAHPDFEGALGEVDAGHLLGEELGAEPLRLRPEVHHQLGAHDALGKAGEVLDVGRQHQLAARLVGRGRGLALDDERGEVGASGVDRGGQAGRAGPDDDDVARIGHGDSRRVRGQALLL